MTERELCSWGARPGRTGASGLRSQGAKRSKSGSSSQPPREIADKRFHRRVPEAAEPEEIHFFQGLFSRPFLEGHAISGNENAGAIVTETAVHENLVPRF